MQAKLPDVNAGITTYRAHALSSYMKNQFDRCITAIKSMIALLPNEYRVEINSQKYEQELATIKMIECIHCPKTDEQNIVSYSDIKVENHLNSATEELLMNSRYTAIWRCPNCNQNNILEKSKVFFSKPENPFYVKVIPEPPRRGDAFARLGYNQRFSAWCEIALPEIENQVQLYRTEYIRQNQDVIESDVMSENLDAELFNDE